MNLMLVTTVLANVFAQIAPPVEYSISIDNAIHHEARITITLTDLPKGPLELVMSRSSPGRYAIHDFAKNVYEFKAVDRRGNELAFSRPNPHEWHVDHNGGTVKIEYTLFGDTVDGTYAAIDATHLHLNAPATFIWARGLEDRPVELTLKLKKRPWTVATQLKETKKIFHAPNLAYFMDSPLEAAPLAWRTWDAGGPRGPQTIRLAVHHSGTEEEVDVYAAMAELVTAEQAAVFGEEPAFDHGTYTFIADYLSYSSRDGMEHRNSTILATSRALEDNLIANLGTLSHEFFHAWNMERIRAKAVEPFDFESDNLSSELWFGEGFTSYYDDLIIHRAGLTTFDDYAKGLSGRLNTVINHPGRSYFSVEDMSRRATFIDGGGAMDRTNDGNTFISYYTFGDAIGLGLDLTLRSRFGLSLDDYMRAVWKKHGVSETPYTSADLERVLAQLTRDKPFAEGFFKNYVYGQEAMDYETLLSSAGLLLRKAEAGKPIIGFADISYRDDTATITGPTRVGSPLHKAGLDRGTTITELAGEPLLSADDLEAILEDHEPNDTVTIKFERRLEEIESKLTFAEDPTLEVVPYEHAGMEVTQAMKAFRKSWLSPKSTKSQSALSKECPECNRGYPTTHAFCLIDGEELKFSL